MARSVVDENWDKMKLIWSGSPAVATISGSIASSSSVSPDQDIQVDNVDSEDDEVVELRPTSPGAASQSTSTIGSCPPTKKSNKRTKLQKALPAHERDRVFLDMVQKDRESKERLLDSLREKNHSISQAIEGVGASMKSIGDALGSGLFLIAMALSGQQFQPPTSLAPKNPAPAMATAAHPAQLAVPAHRCSFLH